jgi:long-chain fatty acid transport protein
LRFTSRIVLLFTAILAVGSTAFGSGFLIPEQGAKASGMAGAFAATANDPSAMFFNVAGIAQLRRIELYSGGTIITFKNEFRGDPNDEFSAGTSGFYRRHTFFPPNGYGVYPIGDNITVGVGMFAAFGLRTNWEEPWIGRFSSRDANLKSVSVQPSIAWQNDAGTIALGAGLEYRRLKITLDQNIPLSGTGVNPFTGRLVDIGNAHLTSEYGDDLGFTVGALFKPTPTLRFGASYRAPMEIDLDGEADFTQILTGSPQIDAIVATQLPVDQKIKTSFPFPAIATIGVATSAIQDWDIEFDVMRTTWSEFDELTVNFQTTPANSFTRVQNWHDATSYRLGANHKATEEWDVRLGVLYDENPQPTEAVSPLLPDSDRTGVSFGAGWHHGRTFIDGGVLLLDLKERSTNGQSTELNGTYKTNATLWFINFGLRL